jgi:ribosome recycling factor
MFDFKSFHAGAANVMAHLQTEVGALRTGGASPQLLDSVKVEAYGAQMRVTEVAAITVADPTLLVVSPWDASLVGAIEKGIQTAGINLNPIVDGKIIRLSVPPLTLEDRQNMVKVLHQKIEAGRVMLRTVRAETKKEIDKRKGQAGVSEDDLATDLAKLEEEVKKVMTQIDQLAQDKEKQLLKV